MTRSGRFDEGRGARTIRIGAVLALLGVALALPTSCSKRSSPGPTAPGGPVALKLATITTAVSTPIFLTAPPGDAARLFIVEKGGTVRIFKGGALLATPFLDIHTLVSTGGEQGLLSMAFDPNYAANGKFFVSYTDLAGNSRIARYHVSVDPDVAVSAADDILLTVVQPADNHNGGLIAFANDHKLYIGFGDGGGSNDQYGNGQSRDDMLGSLLRIDVSGASGYTVPADNPFASPVPELWDIGLRNPWRFSFDRATGDLYIGDVGQDTHEEVDVSPVATGRGRGLDYGWPIMEGRSCFAPPTGCDSTGLTMPAIEYTHPDGCAVIGGYVYRGTAMPALQGTYFYSDLCGMWVRSFRFSGGVATEATEWPSLHQGNFVNSFGEDGVGELYVLTDSGVYKIVPQ